MKGNFKRILILLFIFALCMLPAVSVFAESDILEVVNNTQNLIFALIRAGGIIILIFVGAIPLGMSFIEHDPSRRIQGVMGLVGGLIIVFFKEILQLIGVL